MNELLGNSKTLWRMPCGVSSSPTFRVGILLSGGVDSSLVTALAVRAAGNVKTFTVSFPGYDEFDETSMRVSSRGISKRSTSSWKLMPRPGDMLPMLARQFDEPLIDSSMIPTYLVSAPIRSTARWRWGETGATSCSAATRTTIGCSVSRECSGGFRCRRAAQPLGSGFDLAGRVQGTKLVSGASRLDR